MGAELGPLAGGGASSIYMQHTSSFHSISRPPPPPPLSCKATLKRAHILPLARRASNLSRAPLASERAGH